jgi:hypothetical protein
VALVSSRLKSVKGEAAAVGGWLTLVCEVDVELYSMKHSNNCLGKVKVAKFGNYRLSYGNSRRSRPRRHVKRVRNILK